MVMPSVREGWCLAAMEAAAQGVPTVAYATAGGIAESVVDGQTGLLVTDERELVAAVSTLLADRPRARGLGECARSRAAQFDWDTTADVVEDVLTRRALSRRR
jgi:glycosyltransferase involved in cell wall biosynthesis